MQNEEKTLCKSAGVNAGIAAIGRINEALDEGDPMKTLEMLQNPAAKLTDVEPPVAHHYHDILLETRREKAHVRLDPTYQIILSLLCCRKQGEVFLSFKHFTLIPEWLKNKTGR